ncbi:MAG: MFS transporter [Pseudomonadota bacterium]
MQHIEKNTAQAENTLNQIMIYLVATGGTLLEWAEYILYAYLAHHFSALYFPSSDPIASITASYAVLGTGFLMRPLGAWVFGHIGDRYGRKPALTYSLLLMGIATAGIGFMPTHEQIGYWAAVGLAMCRLVQGFALGGEFHGAGIYLVEHSKKNPYFAGSWITASAAFGMVIGAGIAALVTRAGMPTWAWRVPFIAGGVIYGYIFLRRRTLPESPVMTTLEKVPARSASLPLFAFVTVLSALVCTYVYVANVYFVTFLIRELSYTVSQATLWAMIAQCFVTLFIPFFGWGADRWWNPYHLLCFGALAAAVCAPLFFMSALSGTLVGLLGYIIPYAIINGIISGPMIALMVRMFPPRQRYRGISITWNITAAVLGAIAPIVAVKLAKFSPVYPGYYISVVAAVTFFVLLLCRREVMSRIYEVQSKIKIK